MCEHSEKVAKRGGEVSPEMNFVAPQSWTSSLQNYEEISFCHWSHESMIFCYGSLSRLMQTTMRGRSGRVWLVATQRAPQAARVNQPSISLPSHRTVRWQDRKHATQGDKGLSESNGWNVLNYTDLLTVIIFNKAQREPEVVSILCILK